ncbi:MAG: 1-deoxy-D-xylulose-5-phosphate reductoisomerase [Syntrophomonadaceae bacterium]
MDNISNIVILGSTGSIGQQALQVVDKHPDKFRVIGLAAKDEVRALSDQIERYRPKIVSVQDTSAYRELQQTVTYPVQIVAGLEGMCEVAALDAADIIIVAVSGSIGIQPTLAAIHKSKRIALANKETLVAAGDIVMNAAKQARATIIPVDSEHSAIFQCLAGEEKSLKKIWLTASGGPFRELPAEELAHVTVDMALKHPNWKMGPKITIDSATLMNKGLEVIEAHHLFAANYDDIEVLVQPESVIHSMVELVDGSFLGHLGAADMRIPIQYALTYPERMASPAQPLDFTRLGCIHFQKPDEKRFPALNLAYAAGRMGGTMPAVMNAANEVAVNGFLSGKINFVQITQLVEEVMGKHNIINQPDLEMILFADGWARDICSDIMKKGDIG